MQFTAQLDVDGVALEAEDEVTCLVSLELVVNWIARAESLMRYRSTRRGMTGILSSRHGS